MFTDTDLRDPAPPVPGAPERAKVAGRAKQIKRNRRLAAAGGALGLVAVMSLGVVAVSGGSSGSGTSRVEVAGAVADRTTPAPSVFTISGTVGNVPAGVTLTLTLRGDNGTFRTVADGSGNFSLGGVPAGTYSADYSWTNADGSASQVGRLPAVTVSGDASVNFSL